MGNCIGVVVATYNGEKFIEEQLNSIINQKKKPDLIVVSDGCSSDNTVNICENILKFSGIAYKILTSNIPLSVKNNFEKGIKNCEVEYVFCSDQDDFWLETKIQDFMMIFDNENADMVLSNAYITDVALNKTGKLLWNTIGFIPKGEVCVYNQGDLRFLNELNKHNVVTGMCMAFKRKFINDLLPFSENAIHDVWIAYKMNQLGKIVALNSCEVLYRQHGNNVIGTTSSIQSSYKNKNGYYDRVKKRLCFIEDVSRGCLNEQLCEIYYEYTDYLQLRKEFIEKKLPFVRFFLMIRKYKRYEYKWCQIMVKDIYIRWSLKE